MKVPTLALVANVVWPATVSRSVTVTTTACQAKSALMVDAGQDVDRIPIAPIAKSAVTVNVVAHQATLPDRTVASMSTNARADRATRLLNVPTFQDLSVVRVVKVPSEMVTLSLVSLLISAKPALDVETNRPVWSVKADRRLVPILVPSRNVDPTLFVRWSIIKPLVLVRQPLEEIQTIQDWAASVSIVSKTKIVHKIALATSNPSSVSILVIRWNVTTDCVKSRTAKLFANALQDSVQHRTTNVSMSTSAAPILAIQQQLGNFSLQHFSNNSRF